MGQQAGLGTANISHEAAGYRRSVPDWGARRCNGRDPPLWPPAPGFWVRGRCTRPPLLTKRAMKPFDVGVQIGSMWGDHIGRHAHTPEEANQRGGEIAATGTAHKAGIVIKGEHGRQAVLAQKLGHHFRASLRHRIRLRPADAARWRSLHRQSWQSPRHAAASLLDQQARGFHL